MRDVFQQGLKTNWAMKQEKFLRLPMTTNSMRCIKVRAEMEKDLAQLESDIAMLDRYKSTYVMEQDDCEESPCENH